MISSNHHALSATAKVFSAFIVFKVMTALNQDFDQEFSFTLKTFSSDSTFHLSFSWSKSINLTVIPFMLFPKSLFKSFNITSSPHSNS
eukprot:UN25637